MSRVKRAGGVREGRQAGAEEEGGGTGETGWGGGEGVGRRGARRSLPTVVRFYGNSEAWELTDKVCVRD